VGKFSKFRIDLKGMNQDALKLNYSLDNQYFIDIDSPEVQKGKVDVELSVQRKAQSYDFTFLIKGTVIVACDRCLDDMDIPIDITEKLTVKLGPEYAEEGDSIIVVPEEEGDINVAWFIYEFIVLAIPMKHVHAPGKCNKEMSGRLSGVLVNDKEEDSSEGDSDYIESSTDSSFEPDPRWNELKKIIDNN
jgi:uncharacterized metal-binding protein YceD (DUF177 family)